MRAVLILLTAAMLGGCVTTGTDAGNVLAVTNCPAELPVPRDNSFGATTLNLLDVQGIYRKCRAAAIGDSK